MSEGVRKRRRSLEKRVSLAIFGAFVLLTILGVLAFHRTRTLVKDQSRVAHTEEVLGVLGDILAHLHGAEAGQRGYILTLGEDFLIPYEEASREVHGRIQYLSSLVNDNPQQSQKAALLGALVTNRLETLAEVLATLDARGFDGARAELLSRTGKLETDQIRSLVREMARDERALLKSRRSDVLVGEKGAVALIQQWVEDGTPE